MPDEQGKPRPVHIEQVDPGAPMRMMGPMMVDQQVRQAIIHCWMILPSDQRTPERVEQEIRRLVDRALRDLREDASAFGA
jgi:hypothetical protein